MEVEEDKRKNEEFENANKEFCDGVLSDMKEREKMVKKKKVSADTLRLKGNDFFKLKDFRTSITNYMDALKISPYDSKTLLNVAQVLALGSDL